MNVKEIGLKMDYLYLMKDESYIKLKTTKERIEFMLKVIGPMKSLRKSVHKRAWDYAEQHSKDVSRSIAFKNEAINYLQTNNYEKAVDLFTKAILSSPFFSKDSVIHLSQSYALKSKAQFQLKDISGALMSANHSLKLRETTEMLFIRVFCLKHLGKFEESLQYLNQLIEKYRKRMKGIKRIKFSDTLIKELNELKIYLFQQISQNIKNDLKEENLSNVNSTLKHMIRYSNVWIHSNCKLVVNEKKGRHVLANDFIPKGTTILMESPTNILITEKRDTTCHYCYKTGLSSVWPCIGCDEVVYCDEDCSLKAYEDNHNMFCGFVELFGSFCLKFSHVFQMLSKLGVKKAIEFHQKEKSFDFIEFFEKNKRIEGKSKNPLETTLDFESLFLAFYSLSENYSIEDICHINDIIQSIEVALLLEWKQQISFDEQEIERFITLVEIIFKCSNKVMTNVFGWFYFDNDGLKLEKKRLGSCVVNFASLLNHSCQPNVFWEYVGTKYVMTTTEDINSGQELCITYGPNINEHTFVDRQKRLKLHYFFDCDCKACLRDVKTVLCLRCKHCSGPVPFIDIINYFKRDIRCLKCGQKFEEAKETMDILKTNVDEFNNFLNYLQNKNNIKYSVNLAKVNLMKLSQLAYPQSLGTHLKQLIENYVRHQFFVESIQLLEWFLSEIDLNYNDIQSMDSISENVLEELTVWTNCYYGLFLNERTAMGEQQWSNCFYFYSKLIEFLQMLTTEDNSLELYRRIGLFSSKILSLFIAKPKEFLEMILYLQTIRHPSVKS